MLSGMGDFLMASEQFQAALFKHFLQTAQHTHAPCGVGEPALHVGGIGFTDRSVR